VETHYIHPFPPVPVPRQLLATGKETDTVMMINKFFGEVLVSALNPAHISEEQFQRPEETTLNSLQPTAKQAPHETKDHGSNSIPKSGKEIT